MVREVCRHVERETSREGIEWRVMSAFNEAFNNVVEHAYADATTAGDVEITVRVEPDRMVLRMTDGGASFNFNTSGTTDSPPQFDDLSEGGMGLFIIRQSMSEVTYERSNDRNLLTMTRRFSDCAPRTAQHGETAC